MLDVAVAYNRYKFLGYEFLTWLWFLTENGREGLRSLDPELAFLEIGNRMVLENRVGDAVESVTIKGDDAGLEEGRLALKKGAVVTEMNLLYKSGDHEWRFTLKGESFHIAGLKPPPAGPVESREDVEGAILEKVFLCEKVTRLIDVFFRHFIKLRISEKWKEETVPLLREWIRRDA